MTNQRSLTAMAVPKFGSNFDGFLNFLRSEVTPSTISPLHFADAMGINLHTLSHWTGVQEATLALKPTVEEVQCFLRDSIRVIRISSDIADDVEKAIGWFKTNRIDAFDGKTGQSLVSDGRTEDVVGYLLSIESGFVG